MPDILVRYGLVVLFVWAFAVQAGLPIPAVPILVGAGALSGSGHMNLVLAIGTVTIATLGSDLLWYALGRSIGARALAALCRFALDPDSLIRDAKERFLAHQMRYVVLAKFLPGVNPLAAGLAGIVSIRVDRFLLYAAAGALLWGGTWITLGFLCADLLAAVATRVAPAGRPLGVVLGAMLVCYLAWKYIRRRRFLRHLAGARITPIELKRRLDAGDPLVIVDLRTALDAATVPYKVPGARLIDPRELQHPHHTIPRGSEVVFYCAEPREATSARVALRAAAIGFTNVRPLRGGLEAWREAGLPVEPVTSSSPTAGDA
jgi:membrane protein DedA with SNARE-associated domain/rhodanese-related sulfurtransferase